MKKITMYFEDADGDVDKLTGLHIDHGDGSVTWRASGALDDDNEKPQGSPFNWRKIGKRTIDDAKQLQKWTPPVVQQGPSAEDILAAEAKAKGP